jgi:hypothetical protein
LCHVGFSNEKNAPKDGLPSAGFSERLFQTNRNRLLLNTLGSVMLAMITGVGMVVVPTGIVAFVVYKLTDDENLCLAAIAICIILAAAILS